VLIQFVINWMRTSSSKFSTLKKMVNVETVIQEECKIQRTQEENVFLLLQHTDHLLTLLKLTAHAIRHGMDQVVTTALMANLMTEQAYAPLSKFQSAWVKNMPVK